MGKQPYRIRTISEFHQVRGLPSPAHPLISVVDYGDTRLLTEHQSASCVFDFYSISIKRSNHLKFRYGQQDVDFDEGVMFFMAPGQVLQVAHGEHASPQRSGWILLIHPDFLWRTPLANLQQKYAFFGYAVNEGLFLSEREEHTLKQLLLNIRQEYESNLDAYSQDVMIAQLELLLTYSERFYQRQFLTRKTVNHKVLEQMEALLRAHFQDGAALQKGLPTVQGLADALHVSPNYLGSLLKSLTGQSTQQHIHDHLIAYAKEKLTTTDLTVSEIAYHLGFEHTQSFSKLFKAKTNVSPLAFRAGFN
jgi:AraC-like DNA-binding protein